ncbi:hypothetical protein [Streptomyces pinistramenti]|uniref:hypothetical protein n=1 Tax=Streptomyces pinistramenti TaxID=2884812 RepID=UPI001D07C233|nr:hypothetical protein [Streptomyces pinistramenti]MCB5911455.1 hypothetical protein [Streptomyces pinistramenti]
MGSLRNPIGPLPSSIYWRRRAVALGIFALLALLVVWLLNLGGDSGRTGTESKGHGGSGPATSITPGPSSTGPAISQKPGGRDESGSGEGDGDGTGSGGGSGGGSGAAGAGSGGSGGAPIGTGTGGGAVAAGGSLANCGDGSTELALHSVKDSYRPGEKPKFELTVKNSAGADCKVDLGGKAAVLTITDTAGDDPVWASDDCPAGSAAALVKIPAHGSLQRTVEWDRRASAPKCATPSAAAVPAGKYLIEAEVPGLSAARTSFVLAKD